MMTPHATDRPIRRHAPHHLLAPATLAALLVGCSSPPGEQLPPIDASGGEAPAIDAASGDDGGIDAAIVPCELPPMTAAVSTLAGCAGAGADDGPRGTARFANPVNLIVDDHGDVVVADFDNDRLRVVTAGGGTRTLVAQADFRRPFGLALVGGVLYVSTDDNDRGEHSQTTGTVWRVDAAAGVATVVARDLGRPRGLLALRDGRLALSDYLHHTITVLDPLTGHVEPLAGGRDQPGYQDGRGAAARFDGPYGMAQLADGRIAVADHRNHRLRVVALDGLVATLAGTGAEGAADGPAAAACFGFPQAVVVDGDGRLFVTDTASFTIRVLAAGQVTTVAGDGVGGWRDGALREARFWGLEGLALSAGGPLWVADGSRGEDVPYHRVRRVTLP